MVTETVPLEVTVTDFVIEVPTATLPKESDVALKLSTEVAEFNWSASACEVLPAFAVKVTDCALVTEAMFAIKDAVVEPAGTVTEPGTETEVLVVERMTLTPPVGAELDKVTEQESAIDPVIDVLLHWTALTAGVTAIPVPLRLTADVGVLLDKVNCPVTELAEVGSNWIVKALDCPGFRVAEKDPPTIEKPVPVIEAELIAAGAVPLDVTVIAFVTAVPTETLPNASELALKLRAGLAAFN